MSATPIPTTVIRTLEGPCGTAELLDLSALQALRPDVGGTLATWFLTCPRQSPAWDRYALSIVHLREVEGLPAPRIDVLGATHEVLLIAYHPGYHPSPLDAATWVPMFPVNLAHQVVLNDDLQAAECLELAARAVVHGLLWAEPPLSGQREPWVGTLELTAEHLRTGGHHE